MRNSAQGEQGVPLIEPNTELLSFFEGKAQEILGEFEADGTYAGKVSRIILNETKGNVPSVDAVAKNLAMSVRGLQSALKREGSSYTKLAESPRKEMAISYLRDRKASIGEIGYLLGFSEASSFHRAFKKWTNTTPGQFRNGKNTSTAAISDRNVRKD